MIIELFKQITKIPRCSGTHEPFITFMQDYASKYDYICEVDNANNILCYKSNEVSNICLQSHYDIVCLEDGKIPQIIQDGDILKAKDSTLGTDNGIGCAYMLALMSENKACEFLFTCDEEIGLIGANNITLDIKSPNMLNLDSEAMGEICIGCAGGLDIFASTAKATIKENKKDKDLYEIIVSGFDGGHSGVDINKDIPNAIKVLCEFLILCDDVEILDINGGERINSIPKYAKAIIACNKKPINISSNITINPVDDKSEHFRVLDKNILSFIINMQNGVLKYDEKLDVVIDSINLAIVETTMNDVKISLSARSMENKNLNEIAITNINMLRDKGFEVNVEGKYPAWSPDTNEFTAEVLDVYKNYFSDAKLYAIHAGLECAIFKEKYPHLNIASIGPDIHFPHSNKEQCSISSVNKVYDILKNIINKKEEK